MFLLFENRIFNKMKRNHYFCQFYIFVIFFSKLSFFFLTHKRSGMSFSTQSRDSRRDEVFSRHVLRLAAQACKASGFDAVDPVALQSIAEAYTSCKSKKENRAVYFASVSL